MTMPVAEASPGKVLVTGATGYVGGRLWRRLEERGGELRCMARDPEVLTARVRPETEVVYGDVLDPPSLGKALEGVRTAYYLVHSMGSSDAFEEVDREGARNFAQAAAKAGVERIIYLGGLGDSSGSLSPHLRSRQEVGEVLKSTGVGVIELRASIVIGAGSLSFEMIRALVDRLPVMVTPKWVEVRAQPIGVEDLLEYLEEALTLPLTESRGFQIGGPDQVSYGDLMKEYGKARNLRRLMIRIPVLTPYLSSLWLGLVTPLYARVGRKLVQSIVHPTVVADNSALEAFRVRPITTREAIRRAIRESDRDAAKTRWSDAVSAAGEPYVPSTNSFGKRLQDQRTAQVAASTARAFLPIRKIGGDTGWYAYNWLWYLRGFLDLLVGGVGTRRGRRHPVELEVGDALDFWRVEAIEPNRRLLLRAEMRLPGRAWLEFRVDPHEDGSVIRQTASFDPAGWMGTAYWYAVFPLHGLVFSQMISNIAEAGMSETKTSLSHQSA